MVFDRIAQAVADFVDLFHNQPRLDPLMAVPAVVLMVSWPMFQVLFDDQAAAFMSAFVLAMAIRLALRFDLLVVRMGRSASPRVVAAVVLLTGPGILSALIWVGEPIWCQRFLSAYFLVMAGLHGLDVMDGTNRIVLANWPRLVLPQAGQAMSRALVIHYLGMVLLNETLIALADPALWLLYFGLLPLVSRVLLNALYQTVRRGYQGMA